MSRSPVLPAGECDGWGAAPSGGCAVEVEGLVKRFHGVVALDGVRLCIREGEIYGLLGPNASGKTTLIRSLVGMVTPDAGSVRVLGRRLPDRRVLASIGYMPQQAALYPDLTVEENVRFFARISGDVAGVEAALRLVDLTARHRSLAATLSGGMRTRASLACAVVHRPRLLLLDEPTVGVDPQLRHHFWERFRDLAAGGTAILVSSHVMDEAEHCQRLGLIRAGKLIAEGSPDELRRIAATRNLEDAFLALSGLEAPP